ncbi:MAG: TetR/AcrR family transcriptional regulator [Pseudomonadota bacterium]
MRNERPKAAEILACAMSILRERGDHGLTMRKVAEAAGISLGHLQHYFPTKNDVLTALVGLHFAQCTAALRDRIEGGQADSCEERVARLIALGFEYAQDEQTCCVFREFWALSSRNAQVHALLDVYYREYCAVITGFLEPFAKSPAAASAATALLMPWLEGYTVTARALESDQEELASRLAETLRWVLGSDRDLR